MKKLFCIAIWPALFFCQAIMASPAEDQYKKAGLLIDENKYEEAIILLQDILKKNEELGLQLKSRILNNIGYCYYKLNFIEKATSFYKMALEVDPQYTVCLNNYAVILMNQKKYKEALPYLDQAYLLGKNNIKVIFNLFVSHYFLGEEKEALYFLKEAFQLDEDYTENRLQKNHIDKKKIDQLKKYLKGK